MLEYIFENRKYDMALRDVKATLFDIVSAEEAKIASLMDKIYKSSDADYQAQLVDVCNAQDECLKRVLKIFSELEKTLKKLDSYSRELKHIENDNLNDIIANYKGVVSEQAKAIEQLAAAGGMVQEQAAVNEQAMEQPAEMVQEQAVVNEQYPIEEQEINVEPQVTPEQVAEVAPEQAEAVEELLPEQQAEVVAEQPIEMVASEQPEVASEEVVSEQPTEVAQEQAVEELIPTEGVATDTATNAEPAQEDIIIPYDDSISTVVADEVAPKSEEEVQETNNVIIPQPEVTETVVSEEADSQATLISGRDEEKIEGNVAESILTQLIPTENSDATQQSDTAQDITNANQAEDTDQSNKDSTPLIIPMINTGSTENNNEPIVEATANPVVDGSAASENNNIIVFKKKSNDASKVIITSAAQTSKLRGSLKSQEDTLNGLGFFMNDATLENKLVENGLLPGDKQSQIEQMMNTANALYAEGKVEEAQKMYDDISALNKEAQAESVGIAI